MLMVSLAHLDKAVMVVLVLLPLVVLVAAVAGTAAAAVSRVTPRHVILAVAAPAISVRCLPEPML